MNIEPLISPDEFVGLEGVTHLGSGGEGPWLKAHDEVYRTFKEWKSASWEGRDKLIARVARCRQRMGELWGVPEERVAFMPSAAEGMNWLARGLDWRDGDNVVTSNLEFPSVVYAWKQLKDRGVQVRMVPHKDLIVREEDLLAAVDHRTRVMAVSQVSFYTGQCLDLARLSEGLNDVLLAVDATHASGVLTVPADVTDLTVSSSYKWMLATHGVAPCYLSERAETRTAATCFGWHNVDIWPLQSPERPAEVGEKPMPERLEPGNVAKLVVMYLDQSLEVLLEIGKERIECHARDLSEQVYAGLEGFGLTMISPQKREARSGNTCCIYEEAESLKDRLVEQRVLCDGYGGRMRIATHAFNGSADVERFLEVLGRLI